MTLQRQSACHLCGINNGKKMGRKKDEFEKIQLIPEAAKEYNN